MYNLCPIVSVAVFIINWALLHVTVREDAMVLMTKAVSDSVFLLCQKYCAFHRAANVFRINSSELSFMKQKIVCVSGQIQDAMCTDL